MLQGIEEVSARLERAARRLDVVVVGDLDAHQPAHRVGRRLVRVRGRRAGVRVRVRAYESEASRRLER